MKEWMPEGFHTITPYLIVKEGEKAIAFYKAAFHAIELEKHLTPENTILHARLKIGDSQIMLADESEEDTYSNLGSPSLGQATSCVLYMYVEDVDSYFQKAIHLGAKSLVPVSDMFWGDRYCQLQDPFGHVWSLASHKEKIE